MRNKKFFAKALAFAMVMGTVGVHGAVASPVSVVKAAAVPPTIAAPDFTTFTVVLTSGTPDGAAAQDTYVCLQVLKDASGSKVSGEYWYPVDGTTHTVTVDLSFLKSTKAQYIRAVATDGKTMSAVTKIPAQPKTVVKYDAKTGKFVDKSKTAFTDTELAKYEYKSLYGSTWVVDDSTNDGLKSFDLATAAIAGTTIVVRSAADSTVGSEKLVGTEVKVKISAIAKAPKVKVDYAKGTITLPKGAEAKIVGGTSADFVKLTGKLTPTQLLEGLKETDATLAGLIGSGYTLVVRTAKTDKKPASNVAVLSIAPAQSVSADKDVVGSNGESSPALQNVVVTEQKSKSTLTLKQTKAETDSTSNVTTGTISLEISSSATATFRYSLDDGDKWVTVSANSTIELTDGAKIKVSVLPAEGEFTPNEVEITYKALVQP